MQSSTIILRTSRITTNYCRRIALRHQSLKSCQCLRFQSTATDVIPPPHATGEMKSYPPKIEKLVQDISQLSLLEVADLNELLKKTLNIQDAPMMAMSATPFPSAVAKEEEEEVAPQEEKRLFTVKLTSFEEAKKVQLIKAIKSLLPNMNLVQAKKFVESTPQVVKAELHKEEAEKLTEELVAAGGIAEID